MNPDTKANTMLHMQDNREFRKAKNESIKAKNSKISMRNFIRRQK